MRVARLHDVYGVKTFKIIDELFVLNKAHFTAICEGIAALGYADELNFWAYARIDTVKPEHLKLLRSAGIQLACAGD
jgi:anaerobic magnesium-protoporphyrin IX monomethyl ester cyclase